MPDMVVGSFEIEGMDALQAALRASPERALENLGAALWNEANSIMTDAKDQTPVKWGTLRASGTVQMPTFEGTEVEVVLGFGGAAQAYAVIQHERTDFHHTSGKAHYLSDPMTEHEHGMEERLAEDVGARALFPGLP